MPSSFYRLQIGPPLLFCAVQDDVMHGQIPPLHPSGHSRVDGLGHDLFHIPVAMDPVQGQFRRKVLLLVELGRHIDVVPAADVVVHLGKGLPPVFVGGFVKGLVDVGRIDGRQRQVDGGNASLPCLFSDGLQILDDVFRRYAGPQAVGPAHDQQVFQPESR